MPKRHHKRRRKTPDLAERARSLKALGFSSYREYLRSELWASIRLKVLERDRHRCRFGPHRATQVHHYTYSLQAMKGLKEHLRLLVSTCDQCHVHIEFRPNGKKRGPKEVARTARSLKGKKWPRLELMAEQQESALDAEFKAIVRYRTP